MNDYRYLRDIEAVAPTNSFVRYIIERVISDDYRGVQCSQHNRLTFDYFSQLIDAIYSIAGDDVFAIHVGDDRGVVQPQAQTYYQVVNAIKLAVGKGTINSVKKNTFPDIARMGFLNRYNQDGEKIDETSSAKFGVYSVGLSRLGSKFAQATPFERIKLFTDGIDIITRNTASELVEVLYLNDFGIDYIDILEFMYILSDDREGITANDKLRLLLEYRRLSAEQKGRINQYLKLFCNPENRKELDNKTVLRDYSNWKNESQQIYGLLANSTYFKVERSKLILNTGNYGLFDSNANRGLKAKTDYFKHHHVAKTAGYALHHIVPFSKAQTKSDAVFIDDFKNLIYLKDQKHDEFTIAGSKHVIMKYTQNAPHILFLNFSDESFILVDTTKDALVSPALIPRVKDYNNLLLRKFYYT